MCAADPPRTAFQEAGIDGRGHGGDFGLSYGVRRAAERNRVEREADAAPGPRRFLADPFENAGDLLRRPAVQEHPVRMSGGQCQRRLRLPALEHLQRPAWPRFQPQAGDAVEAARKREFLMRPSTAQDLDEFAGAGVTLVVFEQLGAVHAELGLVPTRGDVDRPAAVGETVERGAPLGNRAGQKEAGVNRSNQADAFGVRGVEIGHRQTVVRRTLDLFARSPPALRHQQVVDAEGFGLAYRGEQTFHQCRARRLCPGRRPRGRSLVRQILHRERGRRPRARFHRGHTRNSEGNRGAAWTRRSSAWTAPFSQRATT